MIHALDPLREFTFLSALARLLLALACGTGIGFGRSAMQRTAGMRTYVLASIGACMSVLVTLFLYQMLQTAWKPVVDEVGQKFDASRLASQALTGIGFLGAGIIVKTAHQQVKGLTTATGLFTTVCLGVAAGAGFYELTVLAAVIVVVILNAAAPLEIAYKRRHRNITLNVEFGEVQDIDRISEVIKAQNAEIYDIDVERTDHSGDAWPNAIFIVQLSKENSSHSGILSSVAQLNCVRSVQELIQ